MSENQLISDINFDNIYKDGQEFINDIVKKKYCINDSENDLNDVINRISDALLENFPDRVSDIKDIVSMFRNGRYLPAGSILFGLGNKEDKCSFSNCYGIPIKHDSLEAIYEAQKEMARTMSLRGGVGTNISILRPKNTKVSNAAKYSSGAVSFMPLFSETVRSISQMARRGALIIAIDISHPDLLDFIWCKSRSEEVFGKDPFTGFVPNVNYANISVMINDDFMKAVEENKDWTLIFPDTKFEKYNEEWDGDFDKWKKKKYPFIEYQTLKARDILKQIAESAWISGDPGVAYYDTVVNMCPISFDDRLKPVLFNPCGLSANII